MRLRYAGVCRSCARALPAGEHAVYEKALKAVRCLACALDAGALEVAAAGEPVVAAPAPPGKRPAVNAAGASARREYERRKASDEAKLRSRWGRLGGLAVALSDEKQTTKAWDRGAVGEERLGARLDGLVGDSLVVLHDRRIPGTKANIDHLVVTAPGVWVIDAKRYRGSPALKVEGGILRPRIEKLMVGRRDATTTVDGVLKQMALVAEVVDVPVHGVLCFVDADWPLVGGSFITRGVRVLWPKLLAKVLTEPHGRTTSVEEVQATTRALLAHFPAA